LPEGILIKFGGPLNAFGLIRKKEETLELIRKENRSEDPAKPRILNRQLSMDSGTLLRFGNALQNGMLRGHLFHGV
jgi:hypothetical protein